jgi:hypothetical protein
MATYGGPATGPERVSAEPRKARFFAEQKMRPNYGEEDLRYAKDNHALVIVHFLKFFIFFLHVFPLCLSNAAFFFIMVPSQHDTFTGFLR